MNTDIIFADAARVLEAVNFDCLEGKTVLITGATGLLGTHFLATLALLKKRGMNIYAYAHCHSHPASYTQEIAKNSRILLHCPMSADVIIHAAGYAQPSVFTVDRAETIRINTAWTEQLLGYLRPGGKFLFVSSSEVYSGLTGLVDESKIGTTNPYHPRSCYIEGKRCGEAICYAHRLSGIDAKSARLSLTYGPGVRKGDKRAMSVFIEEALSTGKVAMKYLGKERRTFCYVSDAVELLWQVCLHGTHPIYNIGSPLSTSMREIADVIAMETHSDLDCPEDYEELLGSPEGATMAIGLAGCEFNKSQYGWGASRYVEFKEGLESTIEWHRGLMESA
jgi:UDP-glucuronate decarboxylase